MKHSKIASLPMYDALVPKSDTDMFWSVFHKHADVNTPSELNRNISCHEAWTSGNDLVLSQSCGYPVVKRYSDDVRIVGTPLYSAQGCSGPYYSSAIVASTTSDNSLLDILEKGSVTIAINSFDSFSGWLLLLSTIHDAMRGRRSNMHAILSKIVVTGAHVDSINAVREGRAHIAAIDCVTFSLACKHFPELVDGVAVIGWSGPAPALPYITHKAASDEYVASIRNSLRRTLDSEECQACKEPMQLLDIDLTGDIGLEVYEEAVNSHLRRAEEVIPCILEVISGSIESISALGMEVEYMT